MSFQQFFTENISGEKKSSVHTNVFKGTRTYANGQNQRHNMTYDVNRANPDKSAATIDRMIDGITTDKVATPDLLHHIQTTYKVDLGDLSEPKTLGNSQVEVYSVRGATGQPIIMLRRKS